MQLLSDTRKTARRTRRGESGVDNQHHRDHRDVPLALHAPVLGVFDIVGGEIQVSILVKVNPILQIQALGSVWLCHGPRQYPF